MAGHESNPSITFAVLASILTLEAISPMESELETKMKALPVEPEQYDFKVCKLCRASAGSPVYDLRDTRLWVCAECGAHYIDYLDAPEPEGTPQSLTPRDRAYFEEVQHYNLQRLNAQVRRVQEHRDCKDLRILDIGSGGGLFLKTMREAGAEVCGAEPAIKPALYSREKYGLEVHSQPVEDEFWQSGYRESFDVVTMWDVIEHVNFPRETLQAAANLLKPGGLLLVGTPCREGFYHRFGSLTARLTRGRHPTFLNMMYSSIPHAHKQILSVRDLERLFDLAGLKALRTDVVMELSLPYSNYLQGIVRSKRLAHAGAPVVKAAFSVLKLRNKMISVAEKV
jgi:2-polyprenyl-3-methyl-5-hydroxy-6-metoxy-1,4-benzoquinol methylase